LITNYGSYEQVETITDLSPEAEVAFNYEWDTSGEETCFHTIVALASPVSGETKIHNNGRSATIRLVSYIPEPALLRVEPDYKKGVVGGSIEVNVTVNDLDAYWDLAAFDVKLYYNTAILDVADIELGEFAYRFNMTYQFIKGINEAEGYVHLAYIWNFVELPPEARPTPYDHGVLFTIRFVIKESGTCTLELKDIDLAAFPNATKWCALGSEAITTIAQDGSVEAVPRHLADLNSDGKVDIYDVVLAVEAYGSMLGDPNWNEDADIAEPYGVINIFDIVTICSYYGLTYA
jgi:hypothetical protein